MRPSYTPKVKVTVESKRAAAFSAIYGIELHRLTPDRVEMLAANVYSRVLQRNLFDRMVKELTNTLEHRTAQENARG